MKCQLNAAERNNTSAAHVAAHTPSLFSNDLHTVWQHLVIDRFRLLLLLSGIQFQIMSRVPHLCHHLFLVKRHTCFIQSTKTERSL